MDSIWGLLAIALAYLAGSVPVAYLVTRAIRGVDIRKVGSGNVGATNVIVHVGRVPGTIVLAIDVTKGALAMLLPLLLDAPEWIAYGVVIAIIVGHNWPIFLGFRGGRGVAAAFGSSLVVLPVLTLYVISAVALVLWRTHNIVPAVLVGLVLLNVLTWLTGQSVELVAFCLIVTLLAMTAHLERAAPRLLVALGQRRWWALFTAE
jgi:glycerol-3-phosphate acyltransferase PlsY